MTDHNDPHPSAEAGASNAVRDVIAERARQVATEGWTPNHDDEHTNGSMALAAACYACNAATWSQRDRSIPTADYAKFSAPGFRWPWAKKWWKPKSQRHDLVRAAALIVAEIERLDRNGIKIRCANRYWSRAVQILLHKHIDATWGVVDTIPWNTARLWLLVRRRENGRWYFSWSPERFFDDVPLPEWDAKALIAAAPKD